MKIVFALFFMFASTVRAGASFIETDIGAIRAREQRAIDQARAQEFDRLFRQNQVLLNIIAPFAREHGGLAGEPSCNGSPYPLKIGNEPWYDYRPFSAISPRTVWTIQNCKVKVNDGYDCTLNYYRRPPAQTGPTFHCIRGTEDHDFTWRAGIKRRR